MVLKEVSNILLYACDVSLQVGQFIKPSVILRGSQGQQAAMHIHKNSMLSLLKSNGTPYTSSTLSQILSDIEGATADFRTDFSGKGHREMSVKLPRSAVPESKLRTIDACKC